MSTRGRLNLLFFQIFVFQLGFGLVVPVLPLYAQDFALGPMGVGLVVGAYGLARVLADVPAAWLATRWGHGRAMGAGALVLAIGSALTAVSGSLGELLAYRFIAGAGSAITLVVGQAMVAAHPEPLTRSRAIASYQAAFLAGAGLGPMLGGPLAEAVGLRAPFLIYAVLAVAVGLAGLFTVSPNDQEARASIERVHTSWLAHLSILRDLPFLLVSVVMLMMSFTRTGGLHTMIPLLGSESYGMSISLIGAAITTNGLLNMTLTLAVGGLVDRFSFSSRALMIWGSLMLVASLVMFGLGTQAPIYFAAAVLWGVGTGLTGPVSAVLAAERVEGDVTAAFGLFRMISDLGYLAGPLLMGFSASQGGIPFTLYWCAFLLLVCVLAFERVTSPRRLPAAQTAKEIEIPAAE